MSEAPTDEQGKRPRRPNTLLAAVAIGALIVGLGGGFLLGRSTSGDDDAGNSARVTPSPSASPSAAESEGPKLEADGSVAPNIGDQALEVGETRQGASVSTTVIKVKDNYRDGAFQAAENGGRWLGVQVKACITSTPTVDVTVSWSDFEAANSESETFPAASSKWDGFPAAPYPFSGTALKSGCRKGWLLIDVPKGSKVDLIRLGPDDPVAEWKF